MHKSCVEWGSTNTSWHINVHYVKIFMHTQSVKLKHMGMGHIWLKWVGHLWLKWVGQLWKSKLLFFGKYAKKTGLYTRSRHKT